MWALQKSLAKIGYKGSPRLEEWIEEARHPIPGLNVPLKYIPHLHNVSVGSAETSRYYDLQLKSLWQVKRVLVLHCRRKLVWKPSLLHLQDLSTAIMPSRAICWQVIKGQGAFPADDGTRKFHTLLRSSPSEPTRGVLEEPVGGIKAGSRLHMSQLWPHTKRLHHS